MDFNVAESTLFQKRCHIMQFRERGDPFEGTVDYQSGRVLAVRQESALTKNPEPPV